MRRLISVGIVILAASVMACAPASTPTPLPPTATIPAPTATFAPTATTAPTATSIPRTATSVPPTATVSAAPTTASSAASNALVLTPTNRTAMTTGILTAPGANKQKFTLVPIDARAFKDGGTLEIQIQLGTGDSDASFDLFPEGATIPTEGRVQTSVAYRYDVRRGTTTSLTYRFTTGQVFQFGATGNWFSREGATNRFIIQVQIK